MHMDMTVTFGNVLTIAATVGGLFIAFSKLKERLVALETRIDPLWAEYTERRHPARRAEDRE